jgi:hypothetical protein
MITGIYEGTSQTHRVVTRCGARPDQAGVRDKTIWGLISVAGSCRARLLDLAWSGFPAGIITE